MIHSLSPQHASLQQAQWVTWLRIAPWWLPPRGDGSALIFFAVVTQSCSSMAISKYISEAQLNKGWHQALLTICNFQFSKRRCWVLKKRRKYIYILNTLEGNMYPIGLEPRFYFHICLKTGFRDFSGGPVAKTPRSQCRGPGYNP